MRTRNKEQGFPVMLRLAGVLLLLTLLSLHFSGGLLAKYISSDSSVQPARVGSFVLRMDKNGTGSTTLRLDGIEKPGDTATYAVKVSNRFGDNQRAEVDETYVVQITVNGSMPLDFQMTSGSKTVSLTRLTGNKQTLDSDNSGFAGAVDRVFQANVPADRVFYIKATWPTDSDALRDPVFASDSAAAYCVLTLTGQQTD